MKIYECKNSIKNFLIFIIICTIAISLPIKAMNNASTKEELEEELIWGRTYGTYMLPEVIVSAELTFSEKILLMARLINSEAGNEISVDTINGVEVINPGMIAVGNVLINRAKRKGWSIQKVILQRDKRGNPQFDGIDTKRFHRNPRREHIIAAKQSFNIQVVPETVEFFHNPISSTDKGWLGYIEKYTYKDILNHRFCHNPKRL